MKNAKEIIIDDLKKILNLMNFNSDCLISEEEDQKTKNKNFNCNINVESDSNFIIGQHGTTLQALESILRTIIFKKGIRERIIIDINNYRESRKNNIKRLAMELADQVYREKKPQILKPMSAFERRVIHLFLENDERVMTESVGEGVERKVVIKPRSIMESL